MISTFRDLNGFPVSAPRGTSLANEDAATTAPTLRKSTRRIAHQAAAGGTGAQLSLLTLSDVEDSLEKLRLPDSQASVLERLRAPSNNQADVFRDVLEYMADHAEEHAVSMALVWRFAKELEVWKSSANPEWRSESSFLESLHGCQTAKICIQFGTSTDAARRAKINILNRNWGETWYEQACQKELISSEQQGPVSLSKRQLGQLAEISSMAGLEDALQLLEDQIRQRTTTGSREQLGLHAATAKHLLPLDLGSVARQLSEKQTLNASKSRRKKIANADTSEEILELRSSRGPSSLLPLDEPLVAITNKTAARSRYSRRDHIPKTVPTTEKDVISPDGNEARQKRKLPRKKQKEFECGDRSQVDGDVQRHDCEDEDRVEEGSESNSSVQDAIASAATSGTRIEIKKRKLAEVESEEPQMRDENISRASSKDSRVTSHATHLDDSEADRSSIPTQAARQQPKLHLPSFANVNARQPETNDSVNDGVLDTSCECSNPKVNLNPTGFRPFEAMGSIALDQGMCITHGPSASSVSSSESIIEAIVNGDILNSVNPSHCHTHPGKDCKDCGGTCLICEIPSHFQADDCEHMIKIAHQAKRLEICAPNESAQQWIRCIRYASWNIGLMQGKGDVCVLSSQSFLSQTRKGRLIEKPILIREQFAEADEWSAIRYAELLDSVFGDFEVDVRWHKDPEPKREEISKMVRLCVGPLSIATLRNPPNMLNLPDITGAAPPGFLRRDRFRLLDLLVERCKAGISAKSQAPLNRGHIGKQIGMTPFDIASCRRFNMLGWPGAFSGAHVDSTGATWVRNLCGYKLWMFVPRYSMAEDDCNQLSLDGDGWDPQDKARAVILGPGDVFVMPAGLVHAVLTIGTSEPCLMVGGSFWDDRDLLHTLKTQCWIAQNQSTTNELLAFQLAGIILALEGLVARNPKKYFADDEAFDYFDKYIVDLKELGCNCDGCDDDCSCLNKARRCTPFCRAHTFDATRLPPCMLERGDSKGSEGMTEDSDSDFYA